MREIPDAQAEMERLAAVRKPVADRTVTITAGKTAELRARAEFAVTVERAGGLSQRLRLSAGEYERLRGLLARDPGEGPSVTFEDDSL